MQTKAHLLHWVRHWLALGQRVLQKKKKKGFLVDTFSHLGDLSGASLVEKSHLH